MYADDVALHQRIGPVAVDVLGLWLCAEGEEVVLPEETDKRRCLETQSETFQHEYMQRGGVSHFLSSHMMAKEAFQPSCGLAINNLSLWDWASNPSLWPRIHSLLQPHYHTLFEQGRSELPWSFSAPQLSSDEFIQPSQIPLPPSSFLYPQSPS